ncbi:MAG: hypothetical protein IID31_07695 [Planctomycetes bacterium]|nr:hypothetical protein [Planctomycetota bacterium]
MLKALLASSVILLLAHSAVAQDPVLYGITASDLVEIDRHNPSSVTIVGPHGLPITVNGTIVWGPRQLVFHKREQRLVSIQNEFHGSGVDQFLVEYDRSTGSASRLAVLGNSGTVGLVESMEYVDHLGSLVVSRRPRSGSIVSRQLYTLSLDGVFEALVANGRDNDHGVYDSCRQLYYTADANGSGMVAHMDLVSGATTNIGPVSPEFAWTAYSEIDDLIYHYDRGIGGLWTIDTIGGFGPTVNTLVGVVGSSAITGLAFIETECYANCDNSTGCRTLDIFDFLCFQDSFVSGDPYACDCDTISGRGVCDIFDFLCFQNHFVFGCR